MAETLSSLNPARPINPMVYAETRMEVILSAYDKALDSLIRIAQTSTNINTQQRVNYLISQIQTQVINELNQITAEWSQEAISSIYKRGYRLSEQTAREISSYEKIPFGAQLNVNSIAVLVNQITSDLLVANGQMQEQVGRYLRMSAQNTAVDTQISRSILQGEIQGSSHASITRNVINDLREQIFNGNLIRVGGRIYNVRDYAELVTRTRLREAASDGTLNAAIQLGMDLVQIDVHGDACPLCMTRMGRVFSISGISPDFPVLDIKPPFHPNCRCNIFPITRESLEMRGRYEAVSKLSKQTPRFDSAVKAKSWLKDHPRYRVNTYNDFIEFVRNV